MQSDNHRFDTTQSNFVCNYDFTISFDIDISKLDNDRGASYKLLIIKLVFRYNRCTFPTPSS